MALRTWPYEIAAILGAKKVGRPLKIVLHREQMFTNVGSRPATIQKIGLGATNDGKLVGLTHEATGHTSSYEEFTEATVNVSKFMYACPNVTARYRIARVRYFGNHLNLLISTAIFKRIIITVKHLKI